MTKEGKENEEDVIIDRIEDMIPDPELVEMEKKLSSERK